MSSSVTRVIALLQLDVGSPTVDPDQRERVSQAIDDLQAGADSESTRDLLREMWGLWYTCYQETRNPLFEDNAEDFGVVWQEMERHLKFEVSVAEELVVAGAAS